MFCVYCGKEISNESRFCPYCGANIGNKGSTINATNNNTYTEDMIKEQQKAEYLKKEKIEVIAVVAITAGIIIFVL